MKNEVTWLVTILSQVTEFLHSIQYEQWFIFSVLLLLVIACIVRLVRIIMILLSPNGYSRDHNRVIGWVSQIAFLFAMAFEIPIWFFGEDGMLIVLQNADKLTGIIHICLMVFTLLLAGISMLFKRNGKRTYISRALCRSSIVLAIEGSLVFVAGYFMIP